MARNATIYKAELRIADMDRGVYADHALTLACQPSETEERLMVRLLAFALNAAEGLALGKGMTDHDEPDIWLRDLTGEIQLWIELGQPDERWLRKASQKSASVLLYTYGRTAETWWAANRAALQKLPRLKVVAIDADASQALAAMARRSMQLQFTVQDGQVWVTDGQDTVEVEPHTWQEASAR